MKSTASQLSLQSKEEDELIAKHIQQEKDLIIGAGHWEEKRSQWTLKHTAYNPKSNPFEDFKKCPSLCTFTHSADVDESHFDAIYQSLISGRKFSSGVPLSFVTVILIHGNVTS